MLKGFNSSPEEGHALKAQEEGMTWSVVEEVGWIGLHARGCAGGEKGVNDDFERSHMSRGGEGYHWWYNFLR